MIHLNLESGRSHLLRSYRCHARVQLAWWDGSAIVRGRVRKISRVGACIETDLQPPDSTALWVRIDDGTSSEWIEARIIAVEPLPGFPWIGKGGCRVQVMFPGPHPDSLFRSVFEDLTREVAFPTAYADDQPALTHAQA